MSPKENDADKIINGRLHEQLDKLNRKLILQEQEIKCLILAKEQLEKENSRSKMEREGDADSKSVMRKYQN